MIYSLRISIVNKAAEPTSLGNRRRVGWPIYIYRMLASDDIMFMTKCSHQISSARVYFKKPQAPILDVAREWQPRLETALGDTMRCERRRHS